MKKLGLYVHIPFCERKCKYCDFYSLTKSGDMEKQYIDALTTEIKGYKDICTDYVVDTIFIGGGTPSYVNPQSIGIVLDAIRQTFNIEDNCETSIEVNPNSVDEKKVRNYKQYGINRISIGVQSVNDGILNFIGRLHSANEAINAIRLIKNEGIANINADVMFNIPGQNAGDVVKTLDLITLEGVEHISFYSLKLEENTPLYSMEQNGLIAMIDEEEERAMYYEGRRLLKEKGYFQYEISNFAKAGYECRHNIRYWTGGEYIGFGPFAHSLFKDKRFNNKSNIQLYIDNINNPDKYMMIDEVLDKQSKMFEFIMLGLRMNRGISINEFNNRFSEDFSILYKKQMNKLLKYELVTIDGNVIRLTEKGMDVSNYVFEEFL